jgi:hypothetical protein
MPPLAYLALLVLVTMTAWIVYAGMARRHRQAIARLAQEWDMHYSPSDQFDLAARVAQSFPIPGAAELRIVDLVYGIERDHYRYIFTAEYTLGVTQNKRRCWRVVSFSEPRSHSTATDLSSLLMAPETVDLLGHYKSLRSQIADASGTAATSTSQTPADRPPCS